MDHFNYRNGQLYAEDVSVAEIAESVGTPFCLLHGHFGTTLSAF